MKSVDELLSITCSILDDLNIDYVIVGGIAVLAHGCPRTTMDVDLVIQVGQSDLARFLNSLKGNGFFVSLPDARDALATNSHFTIEKKNSMFRLDIKGVYNEMDRRTLERRIKTRYNDISLYLESPEDLIANKIFFGSMKDIDDARGVLARQWSRLDFKYLETACRANGVERKWQKLRKAVEKELDSRQKRLTVD